MREWNLDDFLVRIFSTFSIISLTKSFNFENKQLMNLVIVESPAKAKTINKYLGKEYLVLASYGHIRDLPQKMDPLIQKINFKWNGKLTLFQKSI